MFNALNLKATYNTYDDNISEEFYIPVLSNSVSYDRASAYFSAKSLASYAQGLETFIKNGYKYRLIISSELSEEDYSEIKKGYALREETINALTKNLNEQLTIEEEMNISNLAYLISINVLDIKMAFTHKGIFHDKFGIMKDHIGNIISFRGSNNETYSAYHRNYESFDITCSWQASSFDYEKINKSMKTFEKLWSNKDENVIVCEVEKAILENILSYNKGELIVDKTLLLSDCLVLDYNNKQLKLHCNTSMENIVGILNSSKYKMRVKKFTNDVSSSYGEIFFKSNLTYTTFKRIIPLVEALALSKGLKFYTTDRLEKHIDQRELYINERAQLGLIIKQKSPKIYQKFCDYKNIVDNITARKLREQQMWDSFFMYTMKKSSNFSVPGSGKTSSVLGVFGYLHSQNLVDKLIVIGPKNSFRAWEEEFIFTFGSHIALKKFCISDYSHETTINRKKAINFQTGDKNLLLFNYEMLLSNLEEVKRLINDRVLLVFDEIHRIKAPLGVRAISAKDVATDAQRIIAITGTPIPNSYLDIRNLLEILYRDEYDEFFNFSEVQLSSPSVNDIEEINNKLQPFFCRTTKNQLNVPLANPEIVITSYASEEENRIFEILKLKYAKNKLALIIRLLQLESNPQMLLESLNDSQEDFSDILDTRGEIEEIDYKDFSEEISSYVESITETEKFLVCVNTILKLAQEGKQVIVWCIFIDSIKRIDDYLYSKGYKTEHIYGETSSEERKSIVDRFLDKKIQILITNPHTLAESVSLHSVCHDAVYFEYSYNLVHLLQSKDRIHRLGLPDNQYTQYYYIQNTFLSENGIEYSLDKQIFLRLKEKEETMLNAIENNQLEPVSTSEEDLDLIFKELGLS